ncbi:MAG: COX15/CtaA family protein [Chloroflexota bacterium]|nr:COX15/CtaA family protein [Chloroflexota bacterium]
MNIRRLVRILAIVTSFATYLILLLGTLVTTTDSGLGCGNSWPFCHGQIIPGKITVAGVIEYSHRVMSSADGLLVVALTLATWLLYRRDFRAKFFSAMSLFFVLLQGALGALTVVYEGTFEKTWFLSVHFGFSLLAFASVILLTIRLFQIHREQQHPEEEVNAPIRSLQFPVWGLAVYTYIVVYTGALVEHSGAILGCGYQYPGCGSTFLPDFVSLAGIQVLHRYAAGLLWFLVLGFLIVVLRRYRARRDIVQGTLWTFVFITLQAISGMANVLSGGQMVAALLHATIISVFFSALCYLCMQVGWPWRRNRLKQDVKSEELELNTVS